MHHFKHSAAAFAVALATACAPAFSQTFPTKPIKLVLPTAAGTAPDSIARILGDKLARSMGQPVIVENKPGAGGILAMNQLEQAPADGYTFALIQAAVATVTPLTYKEARFDIERDFETVAIVGLTPMLITASPKFAARTLADAIMAAKAAPDQVAIGSPNRTSIPHLANELAMALVEDRDPFPNAVQSANWTCVGLCAHESALKGGDIVKLPAFTL